jgi:hypothetical protein
MIKHLLQVFFCVDVVRPPEPKRDQLLDQVYPYFGVIRDCHLLSNRAMWLENEQSYLSGLPLSDLCGKSAAIARFIASRHSLCG